LNLKNYFAFPQIFSYAVWNAGLWGHCMRTGSLPPPFYSILLPAVLFPHHYQDKYSQVLWWSTAATNQRFQTAVNLLNHHLPAKCQEPCRYIYGTQSTTVNCSIWTSVHRHHALAWHTVLFLDSVSPAVPTVTHAICSFMEMEPIQGGQHASLPGATTETEGHRLYEVCPLTRGWAKSTSAGFMPSNASTSPRAPQHTSMEARCTCTVLVAISAAPHLCERFEPKCLFYVRMLKSLMLSPDSPVMPITMYFDMANPLQRTEAKSVVDSQSSWPVVLAPLSAVVTWDGGWEHLPASCDRFFRPRPP